MDLALNNLQWLICHKTNQLTKQPGDHLADQNIIGNEKVFKEERIMNNTNDNNYWLNV